MGGLRGDVSSLKRMKQTVSRAPITVAVEVARQAAPRMTTLTRDAFGSGRSVYGDARPAGVDGQRLTLRKTGATEAALRFVQIGSMLRCVLGPKYARYLIGKYSILPNGALPAAWQSELRGILQTVKLEP